ncbi:hypothetical protein Tco_0503081 [Tanacetum coccineum]
MVSFMTKTQSTSDSCLIDLENQVQRLMEAHLTPKSSVQENKIASSYEIYSGPHDTIFCIENPKQAFVDYASSLLSACSYPTEDPQCSSCIHGSINTITICSKQPNKPHNDQPQDHDIIAEESEEEGEEDKGDPRHINTDPPSPSDPSTLFIMEKYDDPCEEEFGEDEGAATRELEVEYFDKFSTRSKLTYHKYLMCGPIPSLFLIDPIVVGGCPSNLKIPCNIGHVHVEKAYIDLNSPLNVMTCMQYNWIMRQQVEPREDPKALEE